jgi:hypothetical protein
MAQALRLPDLRPIAFAWSNMNVVHALKKQIRSQRSLSIRRYRRLVGKPYLRITSELPVIRAELEAAPD